MISANPNNNAITIEIMIGYLILSYTGKTIFIMNNTDKNHKANVGLKNNGSSLGMPMRMEYILNIILNIINGMISLLKDFIGSLGSILEKYPATKKNNGK